MSWGPTSLILLEPETQVETQTALHFVTLKVETLRDLSAEVGFVWEGRRIECRTKKQ